MAEVKIKVRGLRALHERMLSVWMRRYVGKFKAALSKLSRTIDDCIDEINKQGEWGPEYLKYLKYLEEINRRHESRNAEGQPIETVRLLPGQVRLIPTALKDPEAYFEAKKKLDLEYATAIEEEEKRANEFAKKLNETVTAEVKHLIRTEDYLEELAEMTGEDYALIAPFLDKDLEEFDLSKVNEGRIKKLEKELENKVKAAEQLREENMKLEDRVADLKEKLLKTEKKEP